MVYEIFNNTFRISPFTKAFYLKKKKKNKEASKLEILEDHKIKYKY